MAAACTSVTLLICYCNWWFHYLVFAFFFFLLLWEMLWPKATWGGKGLLHVTAYSPSRREVRPRSQGRNLEAETESRDDGRAGCCLLACLLGLCSATFIIPLRTTFPGTILPTVSEFHPPTSINHQLRNCLTGLHPSQSDGGTFSIQVSSFQMTSAFVKLITANQHVHHLSLEKKTTQFIEEMLSW